MQMMVSTMTQIPLYIILFKSSPPFLIVDLDMVPISIRLCRYLAFYILKLQDQIISTHVELPS
jgi:hypothetical protein